jgi:anthranilate synthase component 2
MILLVDNYDSFTYNLVQQFKDTELVVLRNDDPKLLETAQKADGIVLSPGPGTPSEAGFLEKIVRDFGTEKPVLGICLGHQGIGEVFGGKVVAAPEIMHGKQSVVAYQDKGLFKGLTGELKVMRYHSLAVDRESFPAELEIVAQTPDCIMALQHKKYPIFGLQFHPESLGTPKGQYFIDRFIEIVEG